MFKNLNTEQMACANDFLPCKMLNANNIIPFFATYMNMMECS